MNGTVKGTNEYITYQRNEKHQIRYNLSCWYTQGTTACKHAPVPDGIYITEGTFTVRVPRVP
jgi:hypothetical protein